MLTKERAIEAIDFVIERRPQVYIRVVMNEIKEYAQSMECFNIQEFKSFISSKQPTKLGGVENIEISSSLGFLKQLINIKKKTLYE